MWVRVGDGCIDEEDGWGMERLLVSVRVEVRKERKGKERKGSPSGKVEAAPCYCKWRADYNAQRPRPA
jgi:hypothetical protein